LGTIIVVIVVKKKAKGGGGTAAAAGGGESWLTLEDIMGSLHGSDDNGNGKKSTGGDGKNGVDASSRRRNGPCRIVAGGDVGRFEAHDTWLVSEF